MIENKRRKRLLLEGAERFNAKPKDGIQFLQCISLVVTLAHNFLPTPFDPFSLAHVLKYTPRINKTALGEYVSKMDNIDILKAFIYDFDFKGVRDFD